MKRLLCLLGGHEYYLRCEPGRMTTVCAACGRQTRGVELDAPRYRRTQAPKGSTRRTAQRLHRAWLAYHLGDVA